jgi:class 3 adenylate cyclase
MAELTARWRKRGYDLDFGVGIAFGFATCGEVGFEGRSDYAALGSVTNLAARLSDEAAGGQILVSQRLLAEVEDNVEAEPAGEYTLKGFSKQVSAFNILGLRERTAAQG